MSIAHGPSRARPLHSPDANPVSRDIDLFENGGEIPDHRKNSNLYVDAFAH